MPSSFLHITDSEFNKYDESVVSAVIRKHAMKEGKIKLWADNPQKGKETFLYEVLSYFVEIYGKYSNRGCEEWLDPYLKLETIFANSKIQYLDDDGDVSTAFISELLEPLIGAYDKLIREYKDKSIALETVQSCVRLYFELVQKTVFFKDNSNLRNVQFRNSEYLKNLVLPDYQNLRIKLEEPDLGYIVPFADAFCLQVLLDIADRLESCITADDATKPLRINMECALAEANFGRYMCLNEQSYRITMNRQTSRIVARPIYRRSSVMAVKPLRLFEKIRVFISNDCSKKKVYKVAIIGHCERSNLDKNPCETEVNDLCEMLYGWLEEQVSACGESATIEIEYQVNKADWFDCKGDKRFEGNLYQFVRKNTREFSVIGTVKPIDYEKQFAYSSHDLLEIIDKNDIVFLLEPSFLFFENYDIQKSNSLNYYCGELRDYLKNERKIAWAADDSVLNSIYGSMQSLSSQLNRIMASRSMDSGNICRVINKSYVDEIKMRVKEQAESKCVFIFSSETYGLDMSGMATYPLSRVEKYNRKKMTIYQFCNYEVPSLLYAHKAPKKQESAHYEISLWSVFKYASIRYSFMEKDAWLKDENCFDWLGNYDYFRILKSVLIFVDAVPKGKKLFELSVSLKIKECFDKYIKKRLEETGVLEEERLGTAKKLYRKLLDFYTQLIYVFFGDKSKGAVGVLFKWDPEELDGEHYGLREENTIIRTGFSMNLYSSARNSRDMFFLYLYEQELLNKKKIGGSAILTDSIPNVTVDIDKEIARLEESWNGGPEKTSNNNEKNYFFMDKKLFMDIPDRLLSQNGNLDMVGTNLCLEANRPKVFQLGDERRVDYFNDLADALLDLCEWADIAKSELAQKLRAWKRNS